MLKYLLPVFVFLCTIKSAVGQGFTKDSLAGEWIVAHAHIPKDNLQKEAKQIIETMKKGFTNAKLTFKTNGKFTIEFAKGSPAFMNQFKVISNKDWRFNESKELISVGTKDDNYNHLRMYVKQQEGVVYFILNDTPLMLEMRKTKPSGN